MKVNQPLNPFPLDNKIKYVNYNFLYLKQKQYLYSYIYLPGNAIQGEEISVTMHGEQEKPHEKLQKEEADLKSRIVGKLPWYFQFDQYRKKSENYLMKKLRDDLRKDISEGIVKRTSFVCKLPRLSG